MRDTTRILVNRVVFSRGVSNTWVIPEYFNILRGEYDFSTVHTYIRAKVRLSINLSIRGNIYVDIDRKIGYELFSGYISPLSSFQKLEVTSKVLEDL